MKNNIYGIALLLIILLLSGCNTAPSTVVPADQVSPVTVEESEPLVILEQEPVVAPIEEVISREEVIFTEVEALCQMDRASEQGKAATRTFIQDCFEGYDLQWHSQGFYYDFLEEVNAGSAVFAGALDDECDGSVQALEEAEGLYYAENIYFEIPASDPNEKTIVISAHSDAAVAPGANDNASGVVALIEIAKGLLDGGSAYHAVILFTDAEEHGYVGSRYFAINEMPIDGEIWGNINIDCVGSSTAGDVVVKLAGRTENEISDLLGLEVADTFFRASDDASFDSAGIPSVCLTQAGMPAEINTPADTIDILVTAPILDAIDAVLDQLIVK